MKIFIMFNRQQTLNGEVSSFCICCQTIIATARNLLDLVPSEMAHICEAPQIDHGSPKWDVLDRWPFVSLDRFVANAERRSVLISLSEADFRQASIAARSTNQTVAGWIAGMVCTSTQSRPAAGGN